MNEKMSPAEIYRQWFEEFWNQRRNEAPGQLLAQPFRASGLGPDITDARDFIAFRDGILASMDGLRIEVLETVEEGDRVFGRFVIRAVHRASGKPLEFQAASSARVVDGKIAESHDVVDFLTASIQTGALPEDALPRVLGGERFVGE